MYSNAKAAALVLYLLGVLGAIGVLPSGIASIAQLVAVVLLGLHVLEIPVAFQAMKRYPGPLVDSIALTLLFGFLHWLPLKKQPK